MPKVFVVMPFSPNGQDVYAAILDAGTTASADAGVEYSVANSLDVQGLSFDVARIYQEMKESDIVVVDLSNHNLNVMYELGYAHAYKKPAILIAQDMDAVPSNLMAYRVLVYDRNQLSQSLVPRLAEAFVNAHREPRYFIEPRNPDASSTDSTPTAFVSYSHADKDALERLKVHLKPLERAGLVDVWDDTSIKAGEQWQKRISAALNRAAIAILLISADFLASDFIIDNELPPLLAAAEDGGTVILPIILKPCRFQRTASLSRFQAINPPSEPLLKLDPVEQEDVYAKVAERVEAEIHNREAT